MNKLQEELGITRYCVDEVSDGEIHEHNNSCQFVFLEEHIIQAFNKLKKKYEEDKLIIATNAFLDGQKKTQDGFKSQIKELEKDNQELYADYKSYTTQTVHTIKKLKQQLSKCEAQSNEESRMKIKN